MAFYRYKQKFYSQNDVKIEIFYQCHFRQNKYAAVAKENRNYRAGTSKVIIGN